jgi:hypothetical protein
MVNAMNELSKYVRDSAHLYRVCGHPEYSFYVGKRRNAQFIGGALSGRICFVFFDLQGNLLGTEYFPLRPTEGKFEERSMALERQLLECMSGVELTAEPVQVKRFFLKDARIALLDHPWEEMDETTPEELKAWIMEGFFVLRWGHDFYMDEDGTVTSS